MRAYDFNFLEKRSPWVGLFWSSVFTGFGHIYCHKILLGFVLIGWTYAIAFNTHLPLITLYTCTGQFEKIPRVVDYEWLLFFPSIYFFGISDAYSSVVRHNQLYKEEQIYFLKEHYGHNTLDIV